MTKDELGIVPDDDLGIVPDDTSLPAEHKDLGIVPDNGPADTGANDLEIQRVQEADAKAAQEKAAQLAMAKKQMEAADPRNWTYKQTQDHFKDNPPATPDAEAQATALLEEKKQHRDVMADQIKQAPPRSVVDTIKEVLSRPFVQSPEEKQAHAQNVFALSHIYNVPTADVERNYKAYTSTIVKRDPTYAQMAGVWMMGPIAAGLAPALVGEFGPALATAKGLAVFQGLAEVENAAVSKLKGEKFQWFKGREFKDLLPEEANKVTDEMLDLTEFVGKGIAALGLSGAGKWVSQRFMKDIVKYNDLPTEMYHPTATGEDVKMPIENVVMASQGKHWDSLKEDLSVTPTPKEEVAAKKEAYKQALEQKELGVVPDPASEGDRATAVNVEQKKGIVAGAANKYYADLLSRGSSTSIPSKPSLEKIPEGTGTNPPSTNLETVKSPEGLSTRYVEPSHSMNLDSISTPQQKATILQKQSQANLEAFKADIEKATGLVPNVRVKATDRLVEKLQQYASDGRDPKDIADVLGARVISDNPASHLGKVKSNFDVVETRNYFEKPSLFGYRGINMKVKLPNGQLAEIQLHTPESVAKAGFQHELYEKYSGKLESELTPEEKASLVKDMAEAQRIGGLSKEDFFNEFGNKTPPPPAKAANQEPPPDGLKRRGFVETVRDAEVTPPEVASKVEGLYQPIPNEMSLEEARGVVSQNPEQAMRWVMGNSRATRVSNTIAQLLQHEAQGAGRWDEAIRIAEVTAKKNTDVGQTIQALAMYARLGPDGILRYAAKALDEAGLKLDPKFGQELVDQAKVIEKMPEGRDKDIATARMMRDIANKVPANLFRKTAMVQTLAQLLNPKTMVRNFLGNAGLVALENTSNVVGTGLDVLMGAFTGKRTQTLPSAKSQLTGAAQGAREGFEEAWHGIDLKNGPTDKYNLPKSGVFNSGVMGAFERTLRLSLGGVDRAFYQAAFNESLRNQMVISKAVEPSAEMIEQAHLDGLRRTLQDDNTLTGVFQGIKKAFNAGKDFGMGDMVIKYTQVPANLINRGIEYSPFEFWQTAWQIARPLVAPGMNKYFKTNLPLEFDQAKFVRSTSTALTGSALLVGTGLLLGHFGIVTGKRQKDKDLAASQENAGIREYQINVDALKRFVFSGLNAEQAKFQEGDHLVSYDWFQPASIDMAMGANIALAKGKSVVGKMADFFTSLPDRFFAATETLAEQPLLQGVKQLTGKETISQGIAKVTEGIPASFVPTLLNQFKQLTDNTARNTKDINFWQEAANKAINKIPGASKTLEPQTTTLGKPREMYQLGSNNPFNVFLNPAFVNTYKPDTTTKMVLGIWERSGQTIQFPHVAPGSVRINGEEVKLSTQQWTQYQSYVGRKTDVLFNKLAENDRFMGASDEVKAKLLQHFLTDINNGARIEILGNRPKRMPSENTMVLMKAIKVDLQKTEHNSGGGRDLGIVPDNP